MHVAYIKCLFALLLFSGVLACTARSSKEHIHPIYDLDHPKRISLPASLNEISGLAYDYRDSGLFAEQDEKGIIYKIYPSKPSSLEEWRVAPDGDYEDLALISDTLWLLRSDGKIKAFKLPISTGMSPVLHARVDEDEDEFETLFPASQNELMLLCKNCAADKKGAYGSRIFNIIGGTFSKGSFMLVTDSESSKDKQFRPHPTAAVRDTSRGLIIILCTRPSCLFEVTEQGKVKQKYLLDPTIYKQPEGIALAPDGTLYISTEAAGQGSAELFILTPRKKSVHP
jgi:hypothetical protein